MKSCYLHPNKLKIMRNTISKVLVLAFAAALLAGCCTGKYGKKDPVDYVNNMLVPCDPTVSLPHSMLRVFPCKHEHPTELVDGLPLWVTSHRSEAILTIGFPGLSPDWDNGHVTPYSYETELAGSAINARFAASHQSAIYDLKFREEGPVTLTVNAHSGEMSAEGNIVKGFQHCGGQTKAYVYLEFETAPASAANTDGSHVSLTFNTPELRIRYGVSFISTEQAAKNLAREIDDFNVDALMAEGRKAWNDALGRLEVSGGSEEDLTLFYTSYYRTLVHPVCMSEDGRYWSGEDNQVHEDGGVACYTDDWLWDSCHSAHPLRTIVDVPLEEAILKSYLRTSDENPHDIASFADAVSKGLDIDVEKAAAAAACIPVTSGSPFDCWAASKLFRAAFDLTGDKQYLDESEYYFKHSFDYRNFFNGHAGLSHLKDHDVRHNVFDLIALMGGEQNFVAQLDRIVAETSPYVPYLYNFAGAPWKTQNSIRQMLDTCSYDGMTSFVVFSSMGFFPVCPGKAEYSIGSPSFESSKVHMANDRTFEVIAHNVSKDNKYIQSAKLNGAAWNEPTISHEAIVGGGVLELEMGPLPNKEWGVKSSISYDSYDGLVMAGYQGWFSSPAEGSRYAMGYYSANGSYNVDMLPDVTEYLETYPIPGQMADGSEPMVYSSADYSTIDLHFRWMKEYGLDGVFMQRFMWDIDGPRRDHFLKVMDNAMSCAERYDRAICIMYDMRGEPGEMADQLLRDIDDLNVRYDLFDHESRPSYLWHNGKPLVVIWGIGFVDRPEHFLDEGGKMIDGLKERGYSVMLGVPTYWRELGEDTRKDDRVHEYILKSDIIMPWYVGRFTNEDFDEFKSVIPDDVAWCREHGIGFAGDVWPGFSWRNIYPDADDTVERRGGEFLRRQIDACIDAGCRSIYISMFDEVNEGTAIMKLARDVPVPSSRGIFTPQEDGVPADINLIIAGEASKRLK